MFFNRILDWVRNLQQAPVPPVPVSPPSPPPLETSDAGLEMIKKFEKFMPVPYKDPVGIRTIGYGHVIRYGEVYDEPLTEEEATLILDSDLITAEECVKTNVLVPITQPQFDALVSLTMNIGGGAFAGSTLLQLLNAKDYLGAAARFDSWIFAKGKILPGLVTRREKERCLFEKGVYPK